MESSVAGWKYSNDELRMTPPFPYGDGGWMASQSSSLLSADGQQDETLIAMIIKWEHMGDRGLVVAAVVDGMLCWRHNTVVGAIDCRNNWDLPGDVAWPGTFCDWWDVSLRWAHLSRGIYSAICGNNLLPTDNSIWVAVIWSSCARKVDG